MSEWKSVSAYSAMRTLVTRVTSRAFVGLPLCRNENYMQTIYKFTIDLFVGAQIISIFPNFIPPL